MRRSIEVQEKPARHDQLTLRWIVEVWNGCSGTIFRSMGISLGCLCLCSVGPAHQVALELEGGEPGRFCLEPPGFMLQRWQGGQLLSHAVVRGGFAGPYPFYDARGKLLD